MKRFLSALIGAALIFGAGSAPASATTPLSLDSTTTGLKILVYQETAWSQWQGNIWPNWSGQGTFRAGIPLVAQVSSSQGAWASEVQLEEMKNSGCELRFKVAEYSLFGNHVFREASLGSLAISVAGTPHFLQGFKTIVFSGTGTLGTIPSEYVGTFSRMTASLYCGGLEVLGKYDSGTYSLGQMFLTVKAGPTTPNTPVVTPPVVKPPVVTPPVVKPKPVTVPKSTGSAKYLNTKYKNCSALNKKFSGGIRKTSSTRNKGSALRVTPYTSLAGYNKNKHLDRDKDGIACEK